MCFLSHQRKFKDASTFSFLSLSSLEAMQVVQCYIASNIINKMQQTIPGVMRTNNVSTTAQPTPSRLVLIKYTSMYNTMLE
jgi:hypothetical protein